MKIPKNIYETKPQYTFPKTTIKVLNVGEGDLKVSFDKNNIQERANAKKMIEDLLKQGFAIMVEVGKNDKGPIFQRATKFDYKTSEYIVMGTPNSQEDAGTFTPKEDTEPITKRGRPRKEVRVPMSQPTIVVARSAGGYDPNVMSELRRGLP